MSPCKFFGVSRLSLTLFVGYHPSLLAFRLYPSVWHTFDLSSRQPWQRRPTFGLVEMMGIEPMTPCLQGRCSPSWATPPLNQWKVKSEEWRVSVEKLRFSSFSTLWGLLSFLSVTQNWTTSWSVLESGVSLLSRRLFSYLPTYEYDLTASLKLEIMFSIERRWSSRTFRYGYLVTT